MPDSPQPRTSDKNVSTAEKARGRENEIEKGKYGFLPRTVGVVDRAWVADGRGHARIRFSERASDICRDVRDGIIRGVSIGYSREEMRELEETREVSGRGSARKVAA